MYDKTTQWTELRHCLNLYETQTLLYPLDLHFLLPHAQSSVLGESAEHPESEPYELQRFSPALINGTSTAAAKVEFEEDFADNKSSCSIIMPTRAGRERMLTRRMRDFL